MLEPREDSRLALDALREVAPGVRHVDHLERDTPLERGVLDEVNRPHPAPPDFLHEPVARLGEIRSTDRGAKALDGVVGDPAHGSVPRTERASRRNSSSDEVISRRMARTVLRKSRRVAARWFVTTVVAIPNSVARSE